MPGVQYKPYERRTLENLLSAFQSGLDPGFGGSIFMDIQQGALDRLAQQRGVRQERRGMRQEALSGFGDTLTQAALGGVQPQGLEALAGLQIGANPMLGRAVGGGLDELLSNAGVLSASVPGGTPEGLTDELSTIEATAAANIQAQQRGEINSGFFDTLSLLRARWEAMGFDPATVRKLRDYFAQAWTSAGGTIAGQPGTPEASASSPGIGIGEAVGGAMGVIGGLPGIVAGSRIGDAVGGGLSQLLGGQTDPAVAARLRQRIPWLNQ